MPHSLYGGVIEEIDVESGFQDAGKNFAPKTVAKLLEQICLSGTDTRPCVVRGKIDRNVILGLPLAKRVADPLQITRDIGHYDPPWILFVEYRRGVEAPTWVSDALGGVRPAVSDQLINSLKEMPVGFGF